MSEIIYDTLSDSVMCRKPCRSSRSACEACAKRYKVSRNFVSGIHPANEKEVFGFAIKDKRTGKIYGVLSEESSFSELTYINDNTLRPVTKEELVDKDLSQYVMYGV